MIQSGGGEIGELLRSSGFWFTIACGAIVGVALSAAASWISGRYTSLSKQRRDTQNKRIAAMLNRMEKDESEVQFLQHREHSVRQHATMVALIAIYSMQLNTIATVIIYSIDREGFGTMAIAFGFGVSATAGGIAVGMFRAASDIANALTLHRMLGPTER